MQYKPKQPLEGISNSEENPLSNALILALYGIGAIAAGYFILGAFTIFFVKKIDLKSEVDYFQSGSKKIQNTKIQKLVDDIWSVYPESNRVKIKANINSSSMMNAFMKIGGELSVTQGLITNMKNENELTFVICHEIGHFYNRDVIQGMSLQLGLHFLFSIVGAGQSINPLGLGIESVGLAFNREQEQRADEFALNCLQKYYGHIEGYDGFFKQVLKKEFKLPTLGKKILSFSQTHPMTKSRIENLDKLINKFGYQRKGPLKELDL